MVSLTSLQFYINAAIEVVAILFLLMILISCLFRKNKQNTKNAFALFVLDLILLLACNMTTWVMDGMFVSPSYRPELYTLNLALTVFDFFFYCLASVMFLNYVCTLTGCMKMKKKKHMLIHSLIIYCFIMTGLFASSIKTGWFYYFPADGYTYYTPAYWVLVAFSIPALWLSYFSIFKNRKILKKKMIPLLAYLVIPMLLAIVDQLFSLSISYVCLAFIALSIYMGVDIEMDHEVLEKEAEIIKQKAENTEMKVNLMVSQIQPHFLFNTLGSIYQLCSKDINLAKKTIKSFTQYLRTNMESLNRSDLVPFEKELEHTKTYLSIELLRFSNILNIEYDISCSDFELPALSLQPIVENAVKYGIRSREKGGTVLISTRRENGKIYISVHDDGMGFDTSVPPDDSRVHIGISNVRKRLEYLCDGTLEIESRIGEGTTVIIVLEDEKNERIAD